MAETTYLELSEEVGSHKFYEVIVDDSKLIITYGRIGTDGKRTEKDCGSNEAATKEATKKVKAKKRKGYEDAVKGVRKKRAITRRAITSTRSTAKKAPVLWKFKSGSSAFGIFVDDNHCWVGNESGAVYKLNHQGVVLQQFQLPDGVKCIVADDQWIYAGCDDGNVYDLTGKTARLAYEIDEKIDIFWLDICNGLLAISDNSGNVTTVSYEDDELWTQNSEGNSGWMVRCDENENIFHGHSGGITCYNGPDGGVQTWHQKTGSSVLFGWQEQDMVYGGLASGKIKAYTKDGAFFKEYVADSGVFSCAASENGELVFAGDSSSSVYCFNKEGERLWKLATTCGSAYSMQYHNNKVYIVTTDGSLACIDASNDAVEKAKNDITPEHIDIKAPAATAVIQTNVVETTSSREGGVVVECIKIGGKLKVRPVSEGFNEWFVQFPKNIREEGAQYLVDNLKEASNGSFYRTLGEIKKIIE